jgi:type IV pilus assembly protein PilO
MSVLQELNRIDWQNNPGAASTAARVVLSIGIFAVIAAIGYFVFIKPKIEERDGLIVQEQSKLADFDKKQLEAAQLEPLIEQLKEIEVLLEKRIKELPNRTQMAELLSDVSQEALEAGLQTEKFEPLAEINKSFYAERPIELKMSGTYHQFGKFVSGVANMTRVVILTMHDVQLKPSEVQAGARRPPGVLTLVGQVKTYRYLDASETAAQQPPAPGAASAAPATPAATR